MRTWVKLYTDLPDDYKMEQITDRQFRLMIYAFAQAGKVDEDGRLGPLVEVAWKLRRPATDVQADFEALAALHIMHEQDGIWHVTHFAKRNERAPSADREQVKGRVQKHREKQRQSNEDVTTFQDGRNENVTSLHENGNADVTSLEKNRIDIEKNTRAADEKTSADVEPPQKRTPSPRDADRRTLQEHFSSVTSLPPPTESSRAAGAAWHAPLRTIGQMAGWDVAAGKALISEAVSRMDKQGLTIADPRSIAKVAAAIVGERKRGVNGHASDDEGESAAARLRKVMEARNGTDTDSL